MNAISHVGKFYKLLEMLEIKLSLFKQGNINKWRETSRGTRCDSKRARQAMCLRSREFIQEADNRQNPGTQMEITIIQALEEHIKRDRCI